MTNEEVFDRLCKVFNEAGLNGYDVHDVVPQLECQFSKGQERMEAIRRRVAEQLGISFDDAFDDALKNEEFAFLFDAEEIIGVAAHALGAAYHAYLQRDKAERALAEIRTSLQTFTDGIGRSFEWDRRRWEQKEDGLSAKEKNE